MDCYDLEKIKAFDDVITYMFKKYYKIKFSNSPVYDFE